MRGWTRRSALLGTAATLTSLFVVGGLMPPAAAADPVIIPIEGYSVPITLDPSFNVTIPAEQSQKQVATQCTPIADPAFGNLCIGTATPTDAPPLDVVGLEEISPLVKISPKARAALNPLVAEGIQIVRAQYDLPNDERIGRYARPQLRAYLLDRLLDIMDRKVYGVPLTDVEQRAFDFVEAEFLREDRLLAQGAYDEFLKWKNQDCAYSPPPSPASVLEPVKMPASVTKWCTTALHPTAQAFIFAPPIPSVDDFTSWGAYRHADDLGLNAMASDIAAENLRNAIVGSVLIAGLATAIGAAALTAAIVGTSATISAAVVAAVGSYAAATSAYLGVTSAMAAATTASVGAALAASVVGVVIVGLLVTAIAIWQLVEHESVGKTLKDRLDLAVAAIDPFGLAPVHAGKPLRSEYDPNNPPGYRTSDMVSKLLSKITLWTTLNETDQPVADPKGVWSGNATTSTDIRFVKTVGTGDPTVVNSIQVPQKGGSSTVRFSRDWMIVTPDGKPSQAALSFGYLNEDGEPRLASRAPAKIGGFIVTTADDSGSAGENVKTITFRNGAGALVKVKLRPKSLDDLSGPRPSAVGPLLAGRPVILRPNPVNLDGSTVDFSTAQSDFSYEWTVTRFNPSTGEWDPVKSENSFGTSFTPSQTGMYDARVTMTSIADPTTQKFGAVQFTVSPPPMTATTLSLLDDGSHELELDLQITEPVPSDTVSIKVVWPRDYGATSDPSTTIELPCVQTGPLECTTERTGPLNSLIRSLTTATDLRLPVQVTVTNSTGGKLIHELRIDHPGRPSVAAPPAGANSGLPGSVTVGQTTTQVEMPLRNAFSNYVAATLVPGEGGGQQFGLVDPQTGNTTGSIYLPGVDNVYASVFEPTPGNWQLLVWGNPNPADVGSYEVPIVVQQTNTNRTLVVVVVHVVPSAGDRFRGAIASDVDPANFAVDAPPDIAPVILGGRAEWKNYSGNMCISLQYVEFGAPPVENCGKLSNFYRSNGTARPFPFDELFPRGMSTGGYRAAAWLTGTGQRVDATPLGMTFHLTQPASYPPPEVKLGAVKVKGLPKVGEKLRAVVRSVNPADATLKYQWVRGAKKINGATGKTYTVKAGDLGKRLSVKVVAKKADWTADRATSAKTSPVTN